MGSLKPGYPVILALLGLFLAKPCEGFVIPSPFSGRQQEQQLLFGDVHRSPSWSTALRVDKFNRDIEEKSRQRASGEGGGFVAAGVVLGGLVGGPFGMLFGAAVGNNVGSKKALDRARKEEMEKKGITPEMLGAAEEVGYALEQSMIGMEATNDSLRSQQSLARQIESDMNDSYDKAMEAIKDGREEDAKAFLLKKKQNQEYLMDTLKLCAEAKQRIDVMESNVSALQRRALEVEAMLQRAVGAKARQDSSDLVANQDLLSDTDFSLSREDPLVKKFKDLGID